MMKLFKKMITNRMSVAFLLLLLLMTSCTFLVFFEGIIVTLLTVFFAILLIFWIVYSSGAKKKLIDAGDVSINHTDPIEELESVFKPKSKTKLLFAAYGLTVGVIILLVLVCIVISPEILEGIFSSNAIYFLFLCIFVAACFIVKRRLK